MGTLLDGDGDGDGNHLSLRDYQQAVIETDKLPPGDLELSVLGLFGEVGSLLALIKKTTRDAASQTRYQAALTEELGDTLWYFTSIVARADLDLSALAQRVSRKIDDWDELDPAVECWAHLVRDGRPGDAAAVRERMAELAESVGELVGHHRANRLADNRDRLSASLVVILRAIVGLAEKAQIELDRAAKRNVKKIFGRYPTRLVYPALADSNMPRNERLPRQFRMLIQEQNVRGKVYVVQSCNDIIIGDRLTDNKSEPDDYRFHDVFHIAYAVHLGWSPVLRALFRVKRKSDAKLDENEDGARAVLIEEGISTLVFGRAVARDLFDGVERVDLDLLNIVREFVRGFEAERCALWQWERAILDGFAVFRDLKRHRGGYVEADLEAHQLTFVPIREEAAPT